MIDEKTIDLIIERLNERIRKSNSIYLEKIGKSIKEIRNLKPSEAQQLVQILKYGGSYEEIIAEMSKYTNLDIDEIDAIFSNFAKKTNYSTKSSINIKIYHSYLLTKIMP